MRGLKRLATMTFVGPVLACGHGVPRGEVPPFSEPVTIEVVNENYHDATIYALYEGLVRERLGFVVGHTTDTMTVNWHPTPLRMIMHLVGAGEAVSDVVIVDPGDFVQLRVMPDLHLKTVRR